MVGGLARPKGFPLMAIQGMRLTAILATACLLLVAWIMIMPHFGTNASQPTKPTEQSKPSTPREEFASGRDQPTIPATISPAAFNGVRALGYLRDLCKIGPRVSGTENMKKQQQLIKEHFEKLGAKVEMQRFSAKQVSRSGPVEFANMIISWHPERERRVMICSHYDTRPHADQERDRSDWDKPFVSANDGTAGVAWMMELGNHVRKLPLTVGLDFVLFDGEEFVFDGPGPEARDRYFLGSEHFAEQYKNPSKRNHYYAAAVLLDIAAGRDARFPVEQNSWLSAGRLVEEIWKTAAEMRVPNFQYQQGPNVRDDHLALNQVGIPAVDIIDFSYPHWHKLTDVPDQCSNETMENVSKVLSIWLQRAR